MPGQKKRPQAAQGQSSARTQQCGARAFDVAVGKALRAHRQPALAQPAAGDGQPDCNGYWHRIAGMERQA